MSSPEPNTIVGTPGSADVKEIVRYIAHIIASALDVKASDCLLKNYGTITLNAMQQVLKLFPELSTELNALASKFTAIQEASRKLVGIKDPGQYADAVLTIFTTYNVDPGIYGIFAAIQAMEAAKICSDSDAKFFLVRTLLASSLPNNLYRLLLDYLSLDHNFPINLLKALLETTQ
ncbi:hypothetical protein [Vulcanisaeta souniana]|uniref:Uncharacterized protein n=2 Tax=Vulcanisaeta souniana TaxID=164452 RepID=A0A830EJG3_9CREN|nr:hypothetical protein [Vulcanisaeta souniana]BDR92575.1 hypothetical protein Vsou_16680 [Vulcanisaeta souniana JCM 11219]GGI82830.1 hypothetical protein GCM10007112_19490 [Vulcanisaeta souniana JCM 11219]